MLSTKTSVTLITLLFESFNLNASSCMIFLQLEKLNLVGVIKCFSLKLSKILLVIVYQIASSSFCYQVCPENQSYRLHMFQITQKDKISRPTLNYK